MSRIATLAILGVLLSGAAQAAPRPVSVDEVRRFPPFSLTFQAGAMFPAGDEGSGLERGPQFVGSLGYEMGSSFTLLGEVGLVESRDDARTRVVMTSLNARLFPSLDMRQFYVDIGGGIYHIAYQRQTPVALPSKIRPGLSFGVGYDAFEIDNLTIGIVGSYHGIVVARSDALAYLTLGVYGSLRPTFW